MFDLGIFALKFENTMVTIEIITFKLVLLQSLVQKNKFLKFGVKKTLHFFLGLDFKK